MKQIEDIDAGDVSLDLSILPPETVILRGLDDAILGLTPTDNLIYGFETCVDLTMKYRELSFPDAVDYLENRYVYRAYTSDEKAPIFCKDVFFENK